MESVSLKDIRIALKTIDDETTVIRNVQWGGYIVRCRHALDKTVAALGTFGLEVIRRDIEGGRYNWTHVLEVDLPR